MNGFLLLLFQLAVLVFSVMIHEISHGFTAERLGDPTARLMGRLTLNPLRHLDPFGSIFLPLLLYVFSQGTFMFGWAKPVPYNPERLTNPRLAAGKIAAAGPLSNFLMALAFGILLRLASFAHFPSVFPLLPVLFSIVIYVNILLGVFNLVPLPPLDGSKILFALLPQGEASYRLASFLERYGLVLFLLLLFSVFNLIILPLVDFLFAVVAGRPLGF